MSSDTLVSTMLAFAIGIAACTVLSLAVVSSTVRVVMCRVLLFRRATALLMNLLILGHQ
jgi:hypothetical protein